MGNNEQHIIASIVKVCHKLDQKGFGANHDGNVSVKYADRIFATPTAVSKGDIEAGMIIELDLQGKKIAGHGKPFSEIQLHLAAYNSRPDISAVVHAHPPYSTARGIAGLPLAKPTIPESVVSIGCEIPVAPFASPFDESNIKIVSDILQISNVFMIPGNGVLAVGTDVLQAYLRLELVEHLSKIDFIATRLGEPKYLSDSDVEKLCEKNKAAGLAPPKAVNREPEIVNRNDKLPSDENLRRIIAEELDKLHG